jgi:hypothetical protein
MPSRKRPTLRPIRTTPEEALNQKESSCTDSGEAVSDGGVGGAAAEHLPFVERRQRGHPAELTMNFYNPKKRWIQSFHQTEVLVVEDNQGAVGGVPPPGPSLEQPMSCEQTSVIVVCPRVMELQSAHQSSSYVDGAVVIPEVTMIILSPESLNEGLTEPTEASAGPAPIIAAPAEAHHPGSSRVSAEEQVLFNDVSCSGVGSRGRKPRASRGKNRGGKQASRLSSGKNLLGQEVPKQQKRNRVITDNMKEDVYRCCIESLDKLQNMQVVEAGDIPKLINGESPMPFQLLENSDVLIGTRQVKRMKMEVLYGSERRSRPDKLLGISAPKSCRRLLSWEAANEVWNSAFTTPFSAQDLSCIIITCLKDFDIFIRSKFKCPKLKMFSDIIFVECDEEFFEECEKMLEKYCFSQDCEKESDSNSGALVSSMGLLRCSVGPNFFKLASMPQFYTTCRALSFVNCKMLPMNWDHLSSIGVKDSVLRLEIEVDCDGKDGNISKLIRIFHKAAAVSYRVNHICGCTDMSNQSIQYENAYALKHRMIANDMTSISRYLESRGTSGTDIISELEIDLSNMDPLRKEKLLTWLSEKKTLKTIVLNGNRFDRESQSYMKFLQSGSSLRKIVVTDESYFPLDDTKPSLMTLMEQTVSKNHIEKIVIRNVNPVRKPEGLEILPKKHLRFTPESLLSGMPKLNHFCLENSNFINTERILENMLRGPHINKLQTLELVNLQNMEWRTLQAICSSALQLLTLDLSGFSRWDPVVTSNFEQTYSNPLEFIFSNLKLLQNLRLNDLSLRDEHFFRHLNEDDLLEMMHKKSPIPHVPSLLKLRGKFILFVHCTLTVLVKPKYN